MWWLYWLVIAMHILSILYNVLRGLKHEREFRRIFAETEQTLVSAKRLYDK
jgi:hypothetical protein